jgi:hypothetical protein
MNTQHEADDYLTTHHPESFLLRQIDWTIFGHVGFSKSDSHAKKNTPRTRRFVGLLFGLAADCGVKPRRLVYFQNNEVKPETDFHHVHFLLGPHGMEKFAAEEICELLRQKATAFGLENCKFAPYDPTKDGVGYVTKRVFRTLENGQRVETSPDFFLSVALRKIIQEKGQK